MFVFCLLVYIFFMIDYLMLGHMTRDLLPDGGVAPGGSSLYGALTAYRLGQRVGVVSAHAALPPQWPQSITLAWTSAITPPTFENRYQVGMRTQMIHAVAPPITMIDIPTDWCDAPIVHFGPVLQEIPEQLVHAFPGALIGVTPQGWMRKWDSALPSPVYAMPWQPSTTVLHAIDALVLSIEDVHGDLAVVAAYAAHCPLVALTRGVRGATLFIQGVPVEIDAAPAQERDPTGAGDVFAATLFCRLHAGDTPIEAAHTAAQVAAVSVEAVGAGGLLM